MLIQFFLKIGLSLRKLLFILYSKTKKKKKLIAQNIYSKRRHLKNFIPLIKLYEILKLTVLYLILNICIFPFTVH
jgi:hypothetical protein